MLNIPFSPTSLIPLLIQKSLQLNNSTHKNQSQIFPNQCQKMLQNSDLASLKQQYLTNTIANIIVANQQQKVMNNNLVENQLIQQHEQVEKQQHQQQLQNLLKTKNCDSLNNSVISPSKLANLLFWNNYSRALSNQVLSSNKLQKSTSDSSMKLFDVNLSKTEIDNDVYFDETNKINNINKISCTSSSDTSNSSNNDDYCSETFSEKSDEMEQDDKNSSPDFLRVLLQQQLKNQFLDETLDLSFTASNTAGFTISEILSVVDPNKTL